MNNETQTLETAERSLTACRMKLIALVSMLIDHAAVVLVPPRLALYNLLRGIGRIAFPVYAFLIAEGCRHTRSREKYLLRLGLFALISEIPFVSAFYPQDMEDEVWKIFLSVTNVFYTMFFAVACIHIWETLRRQPGTLQLALAGVFGGCLAFWAWLLFNVTGNALPFILMILIYLAFFLTACHVLEKRGTREREREPDWPGNVLCVLPLLPVFFLAAVVNCDYGAFGVVLICLIYLVKNRKMQIVVLSFGMLYNYGWDSWLKHVILWEQPLRLEDGVSLCFALLAVVLICLYNGQRGRNIKWAFYAAYPVHIAILAVLRMV